MIVNSVSLMPHRHIASPAFGKWYVIVLMMPCCLVDTFKNFGCLTKFHIYFFVKLTSAFSFERYDVVGFESVEQSPESVFVLLFELFVGEVGGEVCHLMV